MTQANRVIHIGNRKTLRTKCGRHTHLGLVMRPHGLPSFRDASISRRRLNASFVEWLMGWPEGWSIPSGDVAHEQFLDDWEKERP